MRALLVCGNANLETVIRVPGDHLDSSGGFYAHAMQLNVSGVGVNLVRALNALGSAVRFLTLAADDVAGRLIRQELHGLEVQFVPTAATPQSLAVVRPDGTHTFYRDLKATSTQAAPVSEFQVAVNGCQAVLMTNIGWTRELLPVARTAGVPILTDVQDISGPDDAYNQPYLRAADVLLLSAARLSAPVEALHALQQRTTARVIIAGLGAEGALLLERDSDSIEHQAAFAVQAAFQGGAGDTLAAAFAHFYFTRGLSARDALRLACAAAALKLRVAGSGMGHPAEIEVQQLAAGHA